MLICKLFISESDARQVPVSLLDDCTGSTISRSVANWETFVMGY